MKKKVTLSLDVDVYLKFQEFCEENDIMLSRRIERLIKAHMEDEG
ncbi:toxin-antitoxin system protein [Candidatus Pacearchaeota archaeon]|nr:toxin-antitoxin system protein [Candidatus Pacearchaeota archaeon]